MLVKGMLREGACLITDSENTLVVFGDWLFLIFLQASNAFRTHSGFYLQCMHGPNCKLGSFCTVGRRVQEVNVLGGLILPVWGTVEKALSKQVRYSSFICLPISFSYIIFSDIPWRCVTLGIHELRKPKR